MAPGGGTSLDERSIHAHTATANFYLLSATGPKMPADLKEDAEKTEDLQRKVHIADRDATVDGSICASLSTRTNIWGSSLRTSASRVVAVVEELK